MKFLEKYKTDGAFKKKVNKFGIFSIVVLLVLGLIYLTEGRSKADDDKKLGNVVQPDNYVVPDSMDFIEDKSAYYGVGGKDSNDLRIPGQHNEPKNNALDDYLKKREDRINRVSSPPSRRDYTPPITRRVVDSYDDDDDDEEEEDEVKDFIVVKDRQPIISEPILSEEERKRKELREKKLRLETGKSSLEDTKNFNVAINGTQTVKNGQSVSFRVLNDAIVSGRELKKNTLVYGVVKFGDYRVRVDVSSVRIGNEIVPVNMVVYGMDGQEGIPITANDILENSKDRAKREAEREIDKADIPGSRILTEVFTKNKNVEVKLINNHRLILVKK